MKNCSNWLLFTYNYFFLKFNICQTQKCDFRMPELYTNTLFSLLCMSGLAVARNTTHIPLDVKYVHMQQCNGFKCFPLITQLVFGGIIQDKFQLISTGRASAKKNFVSVQCQKMEIQQPYRNSFNIYVLTPVLCNNSFYSNSFRIAHRTRKSSQAFLCGTTPPSFT